MDKDRGGGSDTYSPLDDATIFDLVFLAMWIAEHLRDEEQVRRVLEQFPPEERGVIIAQVPNLNGQTDRIRGLVNLPPLGYQLQFSF